MDLGVTLSRSLRLIGILLQGPCSSVWARFLVSWISAFFLFLLSGLISRSFAFPFQVPIASSKRVYDDYSSIFCYDCKFPYWNTIFSTKNVLWVCRVDRRFEQSAFLSPASSEISWEAEQALIAWCLFSFLVRARDKPQNLQVPAVMQKKAAFEKKKRQAVTEAFALFRRFFLQVCTFFIKCVEFWNFACVKHCIRYFYHELFILDSARNQWSRSNSDLKYSVPFISSYYSCQLSCCYDFPLFLQV